MSDDKTNLEKLRILLPHWIQHSHSHQDEFQKWVEIARAEGQDQAAEEIAKALKLMHQTDHALEHALKLLGGEPEGHHHHHHH